MLTTLSLSGFKSVAALRDLELAPLTVFFGPNAAGKSNILDALVVLSRFATAQTVAQALGPPVRGNPLELFTLPRTGLAGLLAQDQATFRIEATVRANGGSHAYQYHYACEVGIRPKSGALSVCDEFLAPLSATGKRRGKPVIERVGDIIRIRRKSKPAHPWEEPVGLNHTLLSNRRYSGKEYAAIDKTRQVLASCRTYYFDPRVAMRTPQPPKAVDDIGTLGQDLAPFLYRLRAEAPRYFEAVERTVRHLIPAVSDVRVDLDDRRGIVDLEVVQDGIAFSSRVLSEGTLRIVALAALALNPWAGSLIAFEEPENGVHPRRLELITDLLYNLSTGAWAPPRQVIVTTHSPLFCSSIVRRARQNPNGVAMYRVLRRGGYTAVQRFPTDVPLLADVEIREALRDPDEHEVFQALWLRGFLDG